MQNKHKFGLFMYNLFFFLLGGVKEKKLKIENMPKCNLKVLGTFCKFSFPLSIECVMLLFYQYCKYPISMRNSFT